MGASSSLFLFLQKKNLMLNFYPGPSKIYSKVGQYMLEALESGILEKNHRSADFMEMMHQTIKVFKEKFNIPAEYKVFFTSSATECWEITVQSIFHGKISFLYNGDFGNKWLNYTKSNSQVQLRNLTENEKLEIIEIAYLPEESISDLDIDQDSEIIAWVAGETSNGTFSGNEAIKKLRERHPEALLITDVTSVFGGYDFDISQADVWFASSQKCLGLPPGLGIMVVSPEALLAANKLKENNHYNSLLNIAENFQKNQTHYTPNILEIFLLGKISEQVDNISVVSGKIEQRSRMLRDFFLEHPKFSDLIVNSEVQSPTVLTMKYDGELSDLFALLKQSGIIVGKGYGKWKADTFRIANFPAIPDADFQLLMDFFKLNF